jgi:hypothetical protein
MSKCTISKTKRTRVKGTGPRRNDMVTFSKIGDVPKKVVDQLNNIIESNLGNDLGSDNYNISQLCDVENVFAPKTYYRQILIQEKNCNQESIDEHVYTEYNENISIPFFNKIYRLRISEMLDNNEMNWHIDTDTSVMCRAQICLNDNDSIMQFNRKGVIEQVHMKKGEMWFINTGWLHRVVTHDDVRRAAIFGFDFKDYIGNVNILSD